MSEQEKINEQLVLIGGYSGAGKSASLRNIRDQDKWMYLNCEAGKRLPFQNKFQTYKITDPWQVHEAFDHAMANDAKFNGIIIDTASFLMEMFESIYIFNATDTQKGWANYFQFWKNLMQDKVVNFNKPVIILAHVLDTFNEIKHEIEVKIPVKGALKNNGLEAYFSTIVNAKKVSLIDIDKYKSDLLTITDEDKELGFKHVFQTRPTKATLGERIRSPMGMFTREQTYMDNDAQVLLDHLKKFYT
jgi:hypothetical protein